MNVITPGQVAEVLLVTDAMGLHREAVRIPLETVVGGGFRIEGEHLVIQVPCDLDLGPWLEALPDHMVALSGVAGLRRADDG